MQQFQIYIPQMQSLIRYIQARPLPKMSQQLQANMRFVQRIVGNIERFIAPYTKYYNRMRWNIPLHIPLNIHTKYSRPACTNDSRDCGESAALSSLKADKRYYYGKQACNDEKVADNVLKTDNVLRTGDEIYYHNEDSKHENRGLVKSFCEDTGTDPQCCVEVIMRDGRTHTVLFNLFSNHFTNNILTPFVLLKEYRKGNYEI